MEQLAASAPSAARAALTEAVRRVAAGEREALAFVYRATSAKLFGICLRILNDREEAEDILQDVYVTLWRKADSFDPAKASPITWLATLARNRAIDRLRGRGRVDTAPVDAAADLPDGSADALSTLVDGQERERLQSCIGALEPQHAGAIRSAFLDGRTYAELAEQAGVPLGTMKSWIRRSLMRLKACLEI